MKTGLPIFLLALSLFSAAAGNVPDTQVAGDAKWLLHLDLAQLRATRIGGVANGIANELLRQKVKPAMAKMKDKLQLDIDPEQVLNQINSVTIYGTDYQSPDRNAVAVVRMEPQLHQVLVGALAGLTLAGTNASVPIEQTQQNGISIYALNDQAFVAALPPNVFIIGRTRGITGHAASVVAGKSPNLTSTKAFSGYADLGHAFFFMAIAEGFNSDKVLPPQAKVLQMADGGRVALGETADMVHLDLALRAKTSETVTQMQQVVQGLIALGSMSHPENKDLGQLMQSLKVSTTRNIVNVSVEYPADQLIQRITEQQQKVAARKAGVRVRAADSVEKEKEKEKE